MSITNFFSTLFGSKQLDAGPTQFVQEYISVAEHLKMREDAVCSSVRDVMTSLGVFGSQYKFKVLRLDDNGTMYAVMIDVAAGFVIKQDCAARNFKDVEGLLASRMDKRYGLILRGLYWRNASETMFERTVNRYSKPTPSPILRPDADYFKDGDSPDNISTTQFGDV